MYESHYQEALNRVAVKAVRTLAALEAARQNITEHEQLLFALQEESCHGVSLIVSPHEDEVNTWIECYGDSQSVLGELFMGTWTPVPERNVGKGFMHEVWLPSWRAQPYLIQLKAPLDEAYLLGVRQRHNAQNPDHAVA